MITIPELFVLQTEDGKIAVPSFESLTEVTWKLVPLKEVKSVSLLTSRDKTHKLGVDVGKKVGKRLLVVSFKPTVATPMLTGEIPIVEAPEATG